VEKPRDLAAMRREKLERLRERGIDPFPHCFHRTHQAQEIFDNFEKLEETEDVLVAGRITALRPMGKASFCHIEDSTAKLQIYLKRDDMDADEYKLLKQLDLGDFIGIRGKVFRTMRGEQSIRALELTVLAKALQPMPVVKEKDGVVYDAFKDRELRYRKRYLDLMVNAETRALFRKRAAVVSGLRRYLDERDFLEVETPVLQTIYGGGMAVPFKTYHRALSMDLYLRIAEELPLKKLIVGGLERVYEIGRVFRNEGVDRQHNPEFTLLEFYYAYADYHDSMDLVEDMIRYTAKAAGVELQIPYGEHTIDLSQPFIRRGMVDLIRDETQIDVMALNHDELLEHCEHLGGDIAKAMPSGKIIEKIFDVAVQPKLIQPTFVMDHPKAVSPLAKSHRNDPENLVERFELFIGGVEYANAFSELNDPDDQRQRFEDQHRLSEAGDEEAHPLDEEYITALEHGMPPTSGVGIGVDRLVMLLTGAQALRDVLLFPHMRPADAADSADGEPGAETD
jgi:lysyl-tRNA synthetase, class II